MRRFAASKQLRLPPHRCFTVSSITRGIRQPPDSDTVNFPGAVQSKFTSDLQFQRPQDVPSIPTYRFINADGIVVDKSTKLDIGKDKAIKMYKDMVTTSVMDLIM
jgi:2-oxoisovalerate dehydrogenase E1 component alpha subunit